MDVARGNDRFYRFGVAHLDQRARGHGAVGHNMEFVAIELDDGGFLALGEVVGTRGDNGDVRRVLARGIDEMEGPTFDEGQLADGHGEGLLDAINILLRKAG